MKLSKAAPSALRVLATLAPAVLTHSAFAQSTQTQALNPVVVTAARDSQPIADALPHTTLISREDIDRAQALDLPSLLVREAGVQLTSNGGRGAVTGLFMRGAPSRQVLVMIDGIPLSKQDASGAVSIEQVMLDQVDHIEIVRGNVSAIYGSGAIGGVIQVFTRTGSATPQGRVSIEAGSRGFAKLSAGASGTVGATRLSIGVSRQTENGFSAQDASTNPAVNPDRDGYDNTSAAFSLAHDLAAGQTLGLSLTESRGKVDYDSAFATAADTQVSRTRLGTASLYSNNQITSNWTSRVTLSEQRDRNDSDETGASPVISRYTTKVQLLNWNNTLQLAPAWRLNAGLEHQRQSVDTDDGFGGLYNRDRSVDAVFAGLVGSQGAHSLQLNVRHDRIEDTGSKTTGYLGYGYELAQGFKAIASVSTAFAAPPLGYLYAPFFGNAALKPEEGRNAEVGLQYAVQGHLLRATLFRSRVRDELEYDLNTSTFGNVARSSNRGFELSYSGQVAGTDLRATFTSQAPRDDGTGAIRQRRARTLASLSATRAFGAWQAGAGWRYAGKRPDVDSSGTAVQLGSYTVVDLTADYALTKTVHLFGRIENAGDERYQTASGYNQQPRSAFIGVRWQGGL